MCSTLNINIAALHYEAQRNIKINKTYSFSKEELIQSGILKLDNMKIKGEITKNSLNDYNINIIIKGTMVLPCAITLQPVNHEFNIKIDGNLTQMLSELNKNYENNQKTIDIFPIIWENILMEIPIKVVSKNVTKVQTKGNGWELITKKKEQVNPSLAKLKDLL